MTDIQFCSEVKEDEKVEVSRVGVGEEVITDFKEGSFCAVLGTEARLKEFKQSVTDEVRRDLSGNKTFEDF